LGSSRVIIDRANGPPIEEADAGPRVVPSYSPQAFDLLSYLWLVRRGIDAK
jgi:hypothetical protein